MEQSNKWKLTMRARRGIGALIALALGVYISPPVQQVVNLPSDIVLSAGRSLALDFQLPIYLNTDPGARTEDDMPVTSSMDQRLSTVQAVSQGNAQLELKLLGMTVKTVNVSVVPERVLIPGGQNIGVALRTRGVIVIGSSDVATAYGDVNPARIAGLKMGDRIDMVNGESVYSASELAQMVNECGGEPVSLTIARDNAQYEVSLTPALDPHDNAYRLGAWVRDSTAGVGTLSFYDPASSAYGALGHAICDVDTGEILPVGEGEILKSEVVDIRTGQKGEPGELRGAFITRAERLGDITANTKYGIYGTMYSPVASMLYPDGLPIASRTLVHTGPAQIITTLDSRGECAYDCEITRIFAQDKPDMRSMIVKVTDPELLALTGGIVQGMSGSPIIQDGSIIGAVTHVYVNDPTQGYGIYIEWMLDNINQQELAA